MIKFTMTEAWKSFKSVAFWARSGCPCNPAEEAKLGHDTVLVEDALMDYANIRDLGLQPVCEALGWQGGTLKQCVDEIGKLKGQVAESVQSDPAYDSGYIAGQDAILGTLRAQLQLRPSSTLQDVLAEIQRLELLDDEDEL